MIAKEKPAVDHDSEKLDNMTRVLDDIYCIYEDILDLNRQRFEEAVSRNTDGLQHIDRSVRTLKDQLAEQMTKLNETLFGA